MGEPKRPPKEKRRKEGRGKRLADLGTLIVLHSLVFSCESAGIRTRVAGSGVSV